MRTSLRFGLGLLGLSVLPALSFAAAPVIQRSDAVGIERGKALDYRVVATGTVGSYVATGLPPGVTFDKNTGWMRGTPAESGTYAVKVTASNADGSSSTTITVAVVAPDAAPLIYAPLFFDAYSAPHQGGDQFSCTLQATGSPTGFTATDPLPDFWALQGATMTGRTDKPGIYLVSVAATNGNGVGSAAITIRVHPACTEMTHTAGTLRAGDTFRVTLTFNRSVSFTGPAPYLEFHTYPDGETRRIPYVSGNGSNVLEFAYTVTATDAAGDIILYPSIQPAADAGVDGLTDADGLAPGAALPVSGPYMPTARIAAVAAGGGAVATTSPPAPTNPSTDSTPATTNEPVPSTEPPQNPPVVDTTPTAPAAPTTPATDNSTVTPVGSGDTGGNGTEVVTSGGTAGGGSSSGSGTAVASNPALETPAGGTGGTGAAAEATPTPTGLSTGARLINLSARAAVSGSDGGSFIAGFVVSGSTPKQMLLRAVGPTLNTFGVGDAVTNPRLRIYDSSGRVVHENDDWSGADVSAVSRTVGAFGLSTGSRDAALAVTLSPGSYSMQVVPGGEDGVALAEIYDADTAGTSAPLVNISTRARVDAGERALVAGFVVSGHEPKRLLVRGVGAGLQAYGVNGTVADPVVKVYRNDEVVAQNDNWEAQAAGGASSAEVAAAAQAVSAFPLSAGAKDAAVLVTLPPGAYSAMVTPADGAAGIGLVEVYEVGGAEVR